MYVHGELKSACIACIACTAWHQAHAVSYRANDTRDFPSPMNIRGVHTPLLILEGHDAYHSIPAGL